MTIIDFRKISLGLVFFEKDMDLTRTSDEIGDAYHPIYLANTSKT